MANFAKSQVPQFSVDVYQNKFLPEGGQEVNAIVTVTSTGGGTTGGAPLGTGAAGSPEDGSGGPGAAVVIMVDCSGSMNYPVAKMDHAREATAAAIDVFPGGRRLATADATNRARAKAALRELRPNGGTAIGTWLTLADRLLSTARSEIRHGILLTDGRNEHESPEALRSALAAVTGRFTCDARGVGTDWEVKEVAQIASALLGTQDIVADPAGLAADFTGMIEKIMGKGVADVSLRLWTPMGAEIRFVKQVAPTVEDLTARRSEAAARTGDYPTGSWGDESRDYHLCVRVPAAGVGREMLAARVSLVVPAPGGGAPEVLSQGPVLAVWTDDPARSTTIDPQVAHYTGQAELAQVIQLGLEARKLGDVSAATARLGRAVQLAAASGNEDTAKLLSKVVDVVDAATGTVRLKAKVTEADEMTLETRSTKTVRVTG